jgi:hypothetical protein
MSINPCYTTWVTLRVCIPSSVCHWKAGSCDRTWMVTRITDHLEHCSDCQRQPIRAWQLSHVLWLPLPSLVPQTRTLGRRPMTNPTKKKANGGAMWGTSRVSVLSRGERESSFHLVFNSSHNSTCRIPPYPQSKHDDRYSVVRRRRKNFSSLC